MRTEDMIHELRRLEEAHKNDFVGTGKPNWSLMCRDVANRLEELLKAQEPKVIKNSAGNGICPGCGRIIPAWSSPNHCGYCGQAVKWDG